jgi:hypothetical protein
MTEIGDVVYIFDINNRVYRLDEKGRSSGGPIYRGHFIPYLIVGEDKRSWILSSKAWDGRGVPWPGKTAKSKVLTEAEVEARCWINDHSRGLAETVRRCENIETLKRIAELVGYDAEK